MIDPTGIVVASFWVHRPKDFPKETAAYDYRAMLMVLDRCCQRFGYRHVVLTDWAGARMIDELGMRSYGIDLDRNLMKAVTDVQAAWLESPYSEGVDTLFVGADCIIRRDIRGLVPPGDLSVAYMKGHKKWRLNTGFMYVSAEGRHRVAPVLRRVAQDCRPTMCDDMAALERALGPMPKDYGLAKRAGLDVNFVPLDLWNHPPMSANEEAPQAHVLHFFGAKSKEHFFPWAKNFLPDEGN